MELVTERISVLEVLYGTSIYQPWNAIKDVKERQRELDAEEPNFIDEVRKAH